MGNTGLRPDEAMRLEYRDVNIVKDDATGETINSVMRACLVQFEDHDVTEHSWSLVRTAGQMDRALTGIKQNPGLVLYTIVTVALYGLTVAAVARSRPGLWRDDPGTVRACACLAVGLFLIIGIIFIAEPKRNPLTRRALNAQEVLDGAVDRGRMPAVLHLNDLAVSVLARVC